MEALGVSFLLVVASEMGDKTQLLAFALASRFRQPWVVMAGILVATLANHLLAAALGGVVASWVPERVMAGILAVLFIGFGLWTLRPDRLESGPKVGRWGAFITTVALFFLAEMGDKTQLATMAMGARYQEVAWVTAGTTLGMLVADGLVVWLGDQVSGWDALIQWMRWVAAGLFFLFGAISLWAAVG